MVVMMPMAKAPRMSVEPAAGVMATSPATAPVHAPTVVGFLLHVQSIIIQVTAAVAAATCVTRKALAASPSAPSPLPALNPNHPSQRNDMPMNTNVMLCGMMGCPLRQSSRLPIMRHMMNADMPALMCTTVPPAKSMAPISCRNPPPHTQ